MHAFDLEDGYLHMFTMFPYSRQWEDCYGDTETRIPRKTHAFALEDLGLKSCRRFQYLYDFGDMLWHRVEVLSVLDPVPEGKYPRCVERHGNPSIRSVDVMREDSQPRPSPEDLAAHKSAFEAAMGRREAIGSQVDVTREMLADEYALALRLHGWIKSDERRFWELSARTSRDLTGWLLGLPLDLAAHGLIDEASGVSLAFAELVDPARFLGDRPIYLAEAGRYEESQRQVESNLERFPEDAWVMIKAGDAINACGDVRRAEDCYRRGLEMGSRDRWTREGALGRLVPLLEDQGRSEEAQALEEEAHQRTTRETNQHRMEWGLGSLPIHREGPKIGRNDPCPCGSGKKNKKCCGA